MRRLIFILLNLVVFLGSTHLVATNAYGQKNVCFNNLSKYDLCEVAKTVQDLFAPLLPLRLDEEIVLRSVVSHQNTVILTGQLVYNRESLEQTIRKEGMTKSWLEYEMRSKTKNKICSVPATKKFISLGGAAQYIYKFKNDEIYLRVKINKCSN